jgi:hypothetical protein
MSWLVRVVFAVLADADALVPDDVAFGERAVRS